MKSSLVGLWAAFGVDLPKQNRSMSKVPGLLLSDAMLVIGVGIVLLVILALGIYAWMKFRRRKRRRHISGGEKVYRGSQNGSDAEDAEESSDNSDSEAGDEEDDDEDEEEHHHHHHHGRRRYKYRVRRRGHRSRNPTLAETGGLPPVKTQEPGKPC